MALTDLRLTPGIRVYALIKGVPIDERPFRSS
jgi:hypothetical protein